jgi:hypothetical protein
MCFVERLVQFWICLNRVSIYVKKFIGKPRSVMKKQTAATGDDDWFLYYLTTLFKLRSI